MTLDVFDIVELWREWVVDVDDDDFPVRLALVKEGHDAKDFDLLDLAYIAELFADLANVERVVVAVRFRLCMNLVWVLPCLHNTNQYTFLFSIDNTRSMYEAG